MDIHCCQSIGISIASSPAHCYGSGTVSLNVPKHNATPHCCQYFCPYFLLTRNCQPKEPPYKTRCIVLWERLHISLLALPQSPRHLMQAGKILGQTAPASQVPGFLVPAVPVPSILPAADRFPAHAGIQPKWQQHLHRPDKDLLLQHIVLSVFYFYLTAFYSFFFLP